MISFPSKNPGFHLSKSFKKDPEVSEQNPLLVDESQPDHDSEDLTNSSQEQPPHHFFGLQRPIAEIEAQLAKVQRGELQRFEANFRQLERDVDTYRKRIDEDVETYFSRSQRAEIIRQNYTNAKADAVKTNLLLHSGARDLQIKTDAEFEALINSEIDRHGDEYFITETGEGDQRTYHLRYVTQDYQVQTIVFANAGQAEFDRRIRKLRDEGLPDDRRDDELANKNLFLTHDNFVGIVTDNTCDPTVAGSGHYSTSWEGQDLRAARVREAEYESHWQRIGADFTTGKDQAVRTNLLLHSGARELQITTEAQFAIDIAPHLDQHCDEYFITETVINDDQPTYTLLHVGQDHQLRTIEIPENNQAEFDQSMHDMMVGHQPGGRLALTHDQFVTLVTNMTVDPQHPERAHYSTSREGQNLRAADMRQAEYERDWQRIGADFTADNAAAARTNLLLHSGARSLLIKTHDQFNNEIAAHLADYSDEYFITETGKGNQRTYTLRYVTQNHELQEIEIPQNKRDDFNATMRLQMGEEVSDDYAGNEQLNMTHDLFVTCVTNYTRDPAVAGSGHYSTSREGQKLRAAHMRQASYAQHWNGIGTDFIASDAAAARKNLLLHSGARDLLIKSEVEFQAEIAHQLNRYSDEYFITETVADGQRTYTLRYVDQSHQLHPITIAQNRQASFNHEIGVLMNSGHPDGLLRLTHDQFLELVTDNTSDLAIAGSGHYGTSRAGQNLQAERVRRDRYDAHWRSIGAEFTTGKTQAVKTNLLLHSGARTLQVKSNDEFAHEIAPHLTEHGDEYFITEEDLGDQRTYTLRYVGQDHHWQQIAIPQNNRNTFNKTLRDLMDEQSDEHPVVALELTHDQFVDLVTDNTRDPAVAGSGHYSTSREGQNLRAAHIRQATYDQHWQGIGADFTADNAAAVRKNLLLHSGARDLLIKSEVEFQAEIAHQLNRYSDEYFITETVADGQRTYTLRYVDQSHQLHPIAIAQNRQASFNHKIGVLMNSGHPDGLLRLTHDQFLELVTNNTSDPAIAGSGHYGTSREGQNLQAERVRAARYERHWRSIGADFIASDAAAAKKNRLLHSGARNLQIKTEAQFIDEIAARLTEHGDEYFITQTGGGEGDQRTYRLRYISQDHRLQEIRIPPDKQIAFNLSLGALMDGAHPASHLALTHDQFVLTITDNTFIKLDGDLFDDTNVAAAHFSTSREGQYRRSERIRQLAKKVTLRERQDEDIELNKNQAMRWNHGMVFRAAGVRTLVVMRNVLRGAGDAGVWFVGGTVRNVYYGGAYVCSQIARLARRIGPYLGKLGGLAWYGVKKSATATGNIVVGAGEFIGSQAARIGRRAFPYLAAGGGYLWYGIKKPVTAAGNLAYGAGDFICSQLARAGRRVGPYLAAGGAVSWYGTKKFATATGNLVYGAGEFIGSQIARAARRTGPYLVAGGEYAWYGTKKFATAIGNLVYGAGEFVCSQLARAGRRVGPYLIAGGEYVWYGTKKFATATGNAVYDTGEYVCSQLARAGRRVSPYLDAIAGYTWYGIKKPVTAMGNAAYGAGRFVCSQIARFGRRAMPYIAQPFIELNFYLGKKINDAGRSLSRGWYNKSLIKYFARQEGELLLFESPVKYAALPSHIGYSAVPTFDRGRMQVRRSEGKEFEPPERPFRGIA